MFINKAISVVNGHLVPILASTKVMKYRIYFSRLAIAISSASKRSLLNLHNI
ncbi:hypothetical protein GS682_17615 [Nostoc sp. B(2019)]|nr:hypothetical protein [Nostoc sp. B(2019)]